MLGGIRPDVPKNHVERLVSLDYLDKNLLQSGADEMKKHKVVCCGIARDNASDLNIMIRNIESIGSLFKDYRVIIFENDSSDRTQVILADWAVKNPKVKIISKNFYNKKRPSIKFLAEARNFYLQEIADNDSYQDFDIIMMSDMDMSYGFDIRGIQHTFSQIHRWDAVGANGVSNESCQFYDMFAFQNEEFFLRPPENPKKYWNDVLNLRKKQYFINLDLIPVESCFGGLAFYKREGIVDCWYDSVNEDCEHLLFHHCIRDKNKGKMFMNPALLVRYTHCIGEPQCFQKK